jgi:hypothetical protein
VLSASLFNLITSLLKERTIVDCALEEEVNKKRVCCTKRMNIKEYIEENGCVLTEWVSETREKRQDWALARKLCVIQKYNKS